jgi:hypothetical protein
MFLEPRKSKDLRHEQGTLMVTEILSPLRSVESVQERHNFLFEDYPWMIVPFQKNNVP